MLDICGATMDGTRSDKADVIAYAVQKHRLPIERCVMIGDRGTISSVEKKRACVRLARYMDTEAVRS